METLLDLLGERIFGYSFARFDYYSRHEKQR